MKLILPDYWPPEKLEVVYDFINELQMAFEQNHGLRLYEYWMTQEQKLSETDDTEGDLQDAS